MTPKNALDYAKRFVGHLPIDDTDIKFRLLDDASKKLWMAAPWRWTIGALESVTLVNDQQDYNLTGAYTDLYYLLSAFLTAADDKKSLIVTGVLPVSTYKHEPSQVAYISGATNKLRFLPVPTGYTAGSEPVITAVYKKVHTDIATGTYETEGATGVPDEWFWVYQEIVLMKAFEFSHDPRLGSVTVAPGGVQFTGQRGVVEAAILEMRSKEKKYLEALGVEANG